MKGKLIMKKIVSLFLIIIICFSLCACGGNKNSKFNSEDAFEDKVRAAVAVKCMFSYKDVKRTTTSLTDIDIVGDTYTGKGKVRITDDYGNTYEGKVKAVYKYDEENQDFEEISLDIETPKK